MRVVGTFAEVFNAVFDKDGVYGGMPIDPVIRLNGDIWALESNLMPLADGEEPICDLETFTNYWYESRNSVDKIHDYDVDDFLDIVRGNY